MNSGTLSFLQGTDWTYDAAGNIVTEIATLSSGESITRSFAYDHNWVASRQVVSSGAPTKLFRTEFTFNYNSEGIPVTVQSQKRRKDDGTFLTTTYTYDGRNRLITTTLPDGVQAVREFTGEWITKTYFQAGSTAFPQLVRQFDYDTRGFQTKDYDGRGNLTQYAYDDRGRITSVTNPIGEQTINSYTDLVTTQTETGHTSADGEGQVRKYVYDGRNRLTAIQRKDGSGNYVSYLNFGLDSEGHILSTTDALNRTTSISYDLLGRVTQSTDPGGKVTKFAYDAAGNRVSVIDPLGHEVRIEYDVLNRRTANVKLGVAPNPRSQFAYDAVGNLISLTDPEGHVTTYAYDSFSRLASVRESLGQTVQYMYDGRGRLSQKITGRNQKIVYTYEDWGPVKLEQRYPTTSASTPDRTIGYVRDNDGNVLSQTDDGVQSAPIYGITYDAISRPYDETIGYLPGGNRVLQHRYDRFGNRVALTLQDTVPVSYSYTLNKLNQISSATLAGDSLAVSHYANDALQTVTMPGGVTRSYTYKPNGPIDTIAVSGPAGQIAQYAYTYDDGLNTVSMTDSDGIHTYSYDGLNRLTQALHPAASGLSNENYAYDRVGNRRDPANPSQWTYDSNNRIVRGGALTYSFDGDGNVETRSDGSTYTHDVGNKLVGYNGSASYLYDPGGRRIRKTVAGAQVWFLWDGAHLLAEYDGAGSRTLRYGYMAGERAAAQVQDANGTYYVHTDGAHAPRLLTNSTGAAVWQARYQVYGTAAIASSAVTYNQGFPGQYRDVESGLLYNSARYYEPLIGRYVQKDPVGIEGGLNLYAYAAGNPVSYADPSGLCIEDACIGEGLAVAALVRGIIYYGSAALAAWGASQVYNSGSDDRAARPPPGSKPIDQTDWSGDHGAIKDGVGARGDDSVKISPNGEVWVQNPDGSWTNGGPAGNYTGSGEPSGRQGKDRCK
jgi:RHS repeat-associated protein